MKKEYKMGRCMIITNVIEDRFILDIGARGARPSFKEIKEAVDKFSPPGSFMALMFSGEPDGNPYIHRLIQIDEHTQDTMNDIRAWSDKTFGTDHKTIIGKLNHMREELDEFETEIIKTFDTSDVIETSALRDEIADVNILWLDIVSLAGLTINDLNKETVKKFKIVQTRKWGRPDEKGIIRHVKNIQPKQSEPNNCLKEYSETVCDGCEFKDHNMVGHPAGSSFHSVEKYYCELGYWEDDF